MYYTIIYMYFNKSTIKVHIECGTYDRAPVHIHTCWFMIFRDPIAVYEHLTLENSARRKVGCENV